MTGPAVSMRIAAIEGIHLARLVDELRTAIVDHDTVPDPGIQRLVPDVYPDDREASESFAAQTRDDLLDRRSADAAVVRQGLEPFLPVSGDEPDDEAALDSRELTIPASEIDAWLRTLTALRLVIATRLDVTSDDDDHDPDDPRFGIYDWLGFRLDGLVAMADAFDEDAARDDLD